MTIHEKYGLKTDAKSIRERIEKDDYWDVFWRDATPPLSLQNTITVSMKSVPEQIKDADLALLYEMAEKWEKLKGYEAELMAYEGEQRKNGHHR